MIPVHKARPGLKVRLAGRQVLKVKPVPGAQGIQGQAGEDGVTPTVSVGTTTLPPDTPAYVTSDGSPTNLIKLWIPQGTDANCLSVPTIVSELPEVADPNILFLERVFHTVTGDSFNIVITDEAGKVE